MKNIFNQMMLDAEERNLLDRKGMSLLSNEEKKIYLKSIKDEIKYREMTKYIKSLLEKIVFDECEKRGLDYRPLNVHYITVYEYFVNRFKNKKFKLQNQELSNDQSPLKVLGFYNHYYKNLLVYIGHHVYNKIVDVIITAYHEEQHYDDDTKTYDENLYNSNYINLAFYMDGEIHQYDGNFYKKHHDQNSYEIKANLKSVLKTSKFIRNNVVYGVDKERDLEYLYMLKRIYSFDEEFYNYFETFDRYIKVYREHKDEMRLPKFLRNFLNDDGTFKDISIIINSDIFSSNDYQIEKMIAMVVMSETFQNEVIKIQDMVKPECTLLLEEKNKIFPILYKSNELKSNYEFSVYNNLVYRFGDRIDFKYPDNERLYLSLRKTRLKAFKKMFPDTEFEDAYSNGTSVKKF
ncbi:MAG: hypothetical protein IJR82_04095 [Bacilli bacterium]|nr:hypothetical protein [Bacilli bacterium]